MIIYLHKSCFDGAVSAAAAATLLNATLSETIEGIEPVDYSASQTWVESNLPSHSCVVDFLYHPGARYWWDHHGTTFRDRELERHYQGRKSLYLKYDPSARSCAGLILESARELSVSFPASLIDAIRWADVIDSASYKSPDEAVLQQPPARKISLGFAEDNSTAYHLQLITKIQERPLAEIADMEPFRSAIARSQYRYTKGLDLMKSSITNRLNIAYYELRLANEIVDRMMPYLIFPTALYSLGLVQKRGLIRVTCNANPWQKSNKISLGSLFKEFGGGGHQDVGSALFSESEYNTAKLVLDSIFARVSGKVKQSRGRQHG